MTDRRCIASKGEKKEHLSAQDVTSCCGLLHGDMGCNGGIPSSVYGYYASNGIVTGGNYNDTSMCYSYQLAPCSHHVNSTKFPPCPQEVPTPKCAKSCVDDHASWSSSKSAYRRLQCLQAKRWQWNVRPTNGGRNLCEWSNHGHVLCTPRLLGIQELSTPIPRPCLAGMPSRLWDLAPKMVPHTGL